MPKLIFTLAGAVVAASLFPFLAEIIGEILIRAFGITPLWLKTLMKNVPALLLSIFLSRRISFLSQEALEIPGFKAASIGLGLLGFQWLFGHIFAVFGAGKFILGFVITVVSQILIVVGFFKMLCFERSRS